MTAGIEEVGAVVPAATGPFLGSIGSNFRAHRSYRSVSEHLSLDLGSKRSQDLIVSVAQQVGVTMQSAAIRA